MGDSPIPARRRRSMVLALSLLGPWLAATPALAQMPAHSLMLAWILEAKDNAGAPFVIVDKSGAQIMVFDGAGRLQGASPVLLGSAKGDDSTPGIGERKLSEIAPEERTTPAGRFVAALGRNLGKDDVLWVDYDTAISMHRVITGGVKDRRLQRLATPSPLDNRISYGCINVPVAFFEQIVRPAFLATEGVVYVLPETKPISEVFAALPAHPETR
ncbi:MAG: hypothetical protein B7Y99_12690 [Caulobacterales bacterium 32-69-10]|nr:MAG: hypothetical protein B7Y99_12690 [Caulobacterales bacterium 32-69-10]